MLIAAVIAVVFGSMAFEAWLSAAHEGAQRRRGGVEPPDDVYGAMRVAYPSAFAAMIVEGTVRGSPPGAVLAAGVALFAGAKALKWWAIHALGPCWTFRVIVVPGTSLVNQGPYRFMRHPNYLAVMAELTGVALMTGAIVSGPVAALGFGALIRRRVAVEERALDAILPRN